MLSIQRRFEIVFEHAWSLLPDIKNDLYIADIRLGDKLEMKGVHGTWSVNEHTLTLNPILFEGDNPDQLMEIDVNGNAPARAEPFTSRALHTVLHEISHGIGEETGTDCTPEWLALSGFVESWETPPGTARYVERRPGWPYGPSPWRYTIMAPKGENWFVREYSTKSPHEAYADACAHIALGWHDFIPPNGQDTYKYLMRHVWGLSGKRAISAARDKWVSRLNPLERSSKWTHDNNPYGVPDDQAVPLDEGFDAEEASLPDEMSDENFMAVMFATMRYVMEDMDAASMDPTARHRALMQDLHDSLEDDGEAYAYWKAGGGNPCEYCASLDGRRFRLDKPIFKKGSSLKGSDGKELKLDYDDVWFPPLHPNCRCELERE